MHTMHWETPNASCAWLSMHGGARLRDAVAARRRPEVPRRPELAAPCQLRGSWTYIAQQFRASWTSIARQLSGSWTSIARQLGGS
jgi:hypothetical protein